MRPIARGATVVSTILTLALRASGAGAAPDEEPRYGDTRGGIVAGGAALAAVGAAGLVGSVLLLRAQSPLQNASRPRTAIGAGLAVLGGILLPLGLSLAASGTQQVPLGTTVPRDSGQMVAGGVLSTIGGIALGGGSIVIARERGNLALPGGLAMLGAGNALIAVGLPLWVHGSQRVSAETSAPGTGPAAASLAASRGLRRPVTAF